MKITLITDHFDTMDQAYSEMEQAGLNPVEMNVPAVKNESHWHDFSTWLYVLEGVLHITDTKRERVLTAGPGSRVEVPARVLHSEESSGYRIIAGLSIDPSSMTEPVDRDPALL